MPDTPDEAAGRGQRSARRASARSSSAGGRSGVDADLDVALVAARAQGRRRRFRPDASTSAWAGRACRRRDRARAAHGGVPPVLGRGAFLPDEYGKYAALADAVDTPIAGGEEETTLLDFERLIDEGGVEIVQPDVTRAGGIASACGSPSSARRAGRRCVLHAWSTGIIKAATLHVLAAMEEAEYFEYCVQTTELNQRLVAERFPVVGRLRRDPDGPGLGIEIDEDVLEECRVKEDR